VPARPPFATKARVGALDEVNVMRAPSLMCDLGAQLDQLARSTRSKLAILRRDQAISPETPVTLSITQAVSLVAASASSFVVGSGDFDEK
jgi:hypothetical protein